MQRDFTCKEHIFLLTEALETWVIVGGIAAFFLIVVLVWAFLRQRGDNAALHAAIRSLGGQG